MADDDIPREAVADTVNRLLSAINSELSRYAAAVAGDNEELRANINASHQACVNAAIMSLAVSRRAANERLN